MRNTISLLVLVLSIMIMLTGCQSNQTENMPTMVVSPIPQTPTPLETPEITNDSGALRVTLIYQKNNDPVKFQNIYLAELLPAKGDQEGMFVPALDTNTAPKDESSKDGEVIISKVPPQKYALTLLTPVGPILVFDAATNKEILLEIIAGQITDLGTIKVLLDPDNIEP